MAVIPYYLTNGDLPNLLQLQNRYLKYDTSVDDADVFLPELSTVTGLDSQIQITNSGSGIVTLKAYSEVGPPAVQDTIGGATSFVVAAGVTLTLKIKQIDGLPIEWEIEEPVSAIVAALTQAALATPTYVNYPIGFVVYVTDYAATGKGCSIQKTSVANGDFNDWVVTATESTGDTGGFGQNPA